MRRALAVFAAGSLLALCTSPAFSLGFSRSANHAGLGQGLDFSAAVTLGPGEVLGEKCVAAEVLAGENRVEPAKVHVRVDPASTSGPGEVVVHVTTDDALLEPVVTVNLSLGCPARLSRRFVAFLDPPLIREAKLAAAVPAEDAPSAPAATASTPPVPRATSRAQAPTRFSAQPPTRSGAQRPAKRPSPQRSAASAPSNASRQPSRGSVAQAEQRAPARRSTPAPAPAPASAPRTGPRLSLDAPQWRGGAPAEEAAASSATPAAAMPQAVAASDATVAAVAANEVAAAAARAAEDRIRRLDEELARVRRENAEMQDSLAALNARLRAAEAPRDTRWIWALGLLCALLLIGLILALRRQAREPRPGAWWKSSLVEPLDAARDSTFDHGEPTSAAAAPLSGTEVEAPSPAAAALVAVPESPAAAAPPPAAHRMPAAARAPLQAVPPVLAESTSTASRTERRALAVEELIDLEQQADFFLVLGQDEAAIDLLMTHVRSSGGESPMPYLKLLEIYRRRGDAEAYGRIRERFNHRFNAYAPSWVDESRPSTRTLDDYPRVLERLQQVWGEPWQALDLLDTLLFRPDSTDISFDLPAYADLLFLYAVAGNLAEAGGPVTHVDLLLPLDGDVPPHEIPAIERTTPHLPMPPPRASGFLPLEFSLDLDLNDSAPGDAAAPRPPKA